jgi:RNA polymerase sigma factor (sigma-70 family)
MARAQLPHRCGKRVAGTSATACDETSSTMSMTKQTLIEETLDLPAREAARWRHTPHEQEDLVADGYVGLARAARRYDPSFEVPFAVFARPFVRGAITDSVRARVRRRRLDDGTFVDVVGFSDVRPHRDDGRAIGYEPPDPGPTPLEQIVNLDKLRVLGTLPDRERVALVRTIVDGETAADVADELGVTTDRVYALARTGSARLRRRAA